MPTYQETIDDIDATALDGFFVGWPDPPDTSTFRRLLANSSDVVIAREGDEVVGFVTAISDGVLSAYIPLLEVKPSHHGQGIGSELIRRLLARLGGLYMVDVSCDDDVAPFYERFGFTRSGAAMLHRNYAAQSGRT